jgi:TonB-linked SusC/RagA family outer membrane protein
MKKIRRLGCCPFGSGAQILLKFKLLSVVLLSAFASIAADGYSQRTKPEQVMNPVEQQKKISGKVVDSQGLPVPGATIIVNGTQVGTITDMDGNFTLNIPANAKTLTVSFVGMTSKEVTIGNSSNFAVVLADETVGIDEVVVVGYGVQKKESVVGAITQVDNKSLMKSGNSDVTNAITGKLSGVLTIQNTGEPGASSSEIIIRGLSSWNSSAPLVLVDGVERDFNTLDPNEINSVSVLKDASATAVFGAKGANGVIIVTTKRGRIGKPEMDFSASTGFQKATRIPDHIDSYTTMSMLNVGRMNGAQFQDLMPQSVLNQYKNPSTPLNVLRYPNVNWFDEVTRPFAPTTNANFNVSGGTNFVKYFCSLGYYNEGSFFNAEKQGFYDLNYKYNRFNYRTNVDFSLTKSTTLSFNLGGETGIKNSPNDSPWRNLYSTGPARYPAYFPAWVLDQVPDPDYPDDRGVRMAMNFGEYTGNPYTSLHTGQFNQDLNSKLFTDMLLDQKLDFITKGLSFNGKVALSTYYRNRILTANPSFPDYQLTYDLIGKIDPVTGQPQIDPKTGRIVSPWFRNGQGNEYYKVSPIDINVGDLQGDFYRDLYYEFGFNYSNTFGSHTITGLALMNRQQKNKGTEFAYYNEALVGRATYDYAHKYLIEVNVGYTGSERFAPGNRFGFFPAGAIGWVVSEENFFKAAVPWMSKLKLRYSDGLTGSDAADNRWLYNSGYYIDNAGSPGPYIHEDLGANTTAQWEEARKRDFGVEIGLFKNQLTITADIFDEFRDKMLLSPRSVTMMVGNSFKDLNLGSLKKQGLELEVEFNKTTRNKLNYFVKGIFGYNENRIIFKDDPQYAPGYTKDEGKPLGAKLNGVLLTGTGYYTSVDDIHNNPSPIDLYKLNVGDYKFLDYMVDGKITSLDKYPIKGSTFPPITYSLSSGFTYKNFSCNLLFQGNMGKYVEYNQTYEVEFIKGDWRVHSSQLDFWAPNNPNSNHSTLHYSGSSSADILFWGGGEADRGYQIGVENRFWRNADYLRLKEVFLGYEFKSKLLNNLAGINDLQVYATGTNLWTLTNLIEGDPERKDFNQGFYPQMTSLKFGVKFNF